MDVVGNGGLIGVALFVDGETAPGPGNHAKRRLRVPTRRTELKDGLHRNRDMQRLLLCCKQALITRMARTAVCNRHHSVD
jgi:hypothetical protein